jgi:hypothetical protein
MSLSPLNSASTARTDSGAGGRAERAEASTTGVGTTLAGVAAAVSDGVSATVSFSGEALHAFEQAGESAIDALAQGGSSVANAVGAVLGGAQDVAVGAWHAVQHAAAEVEHAAEAGWCELKHGLASAEDAGEAVVDAVGDGMADAVSATKATAKALGHYAEAALAKTGEAVSEVASGAVFAVAAGGKTLLALL